MTNSVEQICGELAAIDAMVSRHSERLERERGEILNTMNKAQSAFGSQEPGQNIVMTLSHVINSIVSADGALYQLKSDISDFTQQMQK